AGRRPHRPAPGGGDLRGACRWPVVRLPRDADRAAVRGGGQRAAALCRGTLHPQPTVCGRVPGNRVARGFSASATVSAGAGGRVEPGTPDPQGAGGPSLPASGVPQLPLALRYPADQRLDTYVGAPAGVVAQLGALAEG